MDITTSRKRTKKARSRPPAARHRWVLTAVVWLCAATLPGVALLRAAPKKKPREAVAVLAGTVFQSSGRSLPGAKVEAVAQDDAKNKASVLSDDQGDFAIHVPAGRGTYVLTATAKGFEPAQKTVEVYQDEKVRANLILSPQPKK